MSLSYQLKPESVPTFYVKFRSDDLDSFTHGFLRNVARDAFNEVGPMYPLEQIYGEKKEELLIKVRAKVNDQVGAFGIQIEQFGFIGAPRLPDLVVDALNAKITATQKAIQVENELRQAEAEAKKAVAKAEGEAKANQALTASITPALLEWRRLQISQNAIERWNGILPQYNGGGTIPFIQLPAMTQSQPAQHGM
jgi:regulator of protease activity HflC (stomatin/prohibitin superfamily)